MSARFVYKILTEADWQSAQATGVTSTAADRADGYVHLSSAAQIPGTLARHFAGCGTLRLLRFVSSELQGLRWEPGRAGENFPHVYGELRVADADRHWTLEARPDGSMSLPEPLQ